MCARQSEEQEEEEEEEVKNLPWFLFLLHAQRLGAALLLHSCQIYGGRGAQNVWNLDFPKLSWIVFQPKEKKEEQEEQKEVFLLLSTSLLPTNSASRRCYVGLPRLILELVDFPEGRFPPRQQIRVKAEPVLEPEPFVGPPEASGSL